MQQMCKAVEITSTGTQGNQDNAQVFPPKTEGLVT